MNRFCVYTKREGHNNFLNLVKRTHINILISPKYLIWITLITKLEFLLASRRLHLHPSPHQLSSSTKDANNLFSCAVSSPAHQIQASSVSPWPMSDNHFSNCSKDHTTLTATICCAQTSNIHPSPVPHSNHEGSHTNWPFKQVGKESRKGGFQSIG